MKQAGIYTILSPYWGSHTDVLPNWGIPDNANLSALVFFYPKVQKAYKNWVRKLYTTPNPYGGVPLKDDPAVAIIQIQNEDSMLFYTMQRVAGRAADGPAPAICPMGGQEVRQLRRGAAGLAKLRPPRRQRR